MGKVLAKKEDSAERFKSKGCQRMIWVEGDFSDRTDPSCQWDMERELLDIDTQQLGSVT